MGPSNLLPLLLSVVLFVLLHTPALAEKKSYIVYMGGHSSALGTTMDDVDSVTTSHYDLLGSFVGSPEEARNAIIYSYTKNINGFAAVLSEQQAQEISNHPQVLSVFENRKRELHTTHSWNFLGLEKYGKALGAWNKAKFGEDVIIGNLDTGVWPESKSFIDVGYGPIPPKWKGVCQSNKVDNVRCNRKLLGVRYFHQGYDAGLGARLNESLFSGRDDNGHGTHTLSTAGGHYVDGANIFGIGNGTAKGGAPKARVAAYKVCWQVTGENQCFDADILAGFDAAISDGVDILSVSLGAKASEYFSDGISVGTFHAVKKGILVVASAGNEGPLPGSVTNVAPWVFTVGASTMDRDFANYVTLGNEKRFQGTSLSSGLPQGKLYTLISAADAKVAAATPEDALLCKNGTLDKKLVEGKIVVCLRGVNPRVEKGHQALLAGAVGMILANEESSGDGLLADPHFLPASHITYKDGLQLFAYINSTKNPTGNISPVQTILGVKPAPVMASFSSRGPNPVEPSILKPDITGPGVSIIAAFSEAVGPSEQPFDKNRVPFNILSGTSMSCPHVAGISALLKALYPQWSPAAIRSAIMTTAKVGDNNGTAIGDSTGLPASPFAYGAGHVNPSKAMDPGLVYDATTEDYLNFLCARGYNQSVIQVFADEQRSCSNDSKVADLNYPSISVSSLQEQPVTVTRTVTNVGAPGTYQVRVRQPAGLSISVNPTTLEFKAAGEKKTFRVTLKLTAGPLKATVFGGLTWSDGHHNVRSPVAASSATE
jgi:subtilisin family serine protease